MPGKKNWEARAGYGFGPEKAGSDRPEKAMGGEMAQALQNTQASFWPRVWNWRETQVEAVGTWRRHAPTEPETGQGWYDEESNCLYIWDGMEWVCVPAD